MKVDLYYKRKKWVIYSMKPEDPYWKILVV